MVSKLRSLVHYLHQLPERTKQLLFPFSQRQDDGVLKMRPVAHHSYQHSHKHSYCPLGHCGPSKVTPCPCNGCAYWAGSLFSAQLLSPSLHKSCKPSFPLPAFRAFTQLHSFPRLVARSKLTALNLSLVKVSATGRN